MTILCTSVFHAMGLVLLRSASLLLPPTERKEWSREWRSELWHVRQACTPRKGISWSGEREVTAFCMGAFQDVFCLRRDLSQIALPLSMARGSARQCLILLAVVAIASCGIATLLPNVRVQFQPTGYHLPVDLVLIRDAQATNDSVPTISGNQFRLWKKRRQQLFDNFAFYRIVDEPLSTAPSRRPVVRIAHSSSNLFELLHIPMRFTSPNRKAYADMPKMILSDAMWTREFNRNPYIAGRVVRVGSREAVIDGVAPADASRLPDKVDAWLLEPDSAIASDGMGYVMAHLTPSASRNRGCENWNMIAPRSDGVLDDFLCVSLTNSTPGLSTIFLFAVFMACLAVPATTPLTLGEHLLSSRKIFWQTRLRRWSFLVGKITLVLPTVYFLSIDVAYMYSGLLPASSIYVQIVCSFSICLSGLRWALRDQRQRCPVCLGKLTHPARVGQPSRNFLAWNGTELMCVDGHGLMHVPELATSWFSTQRWMYLDASWEVLFAEPPIVTTGHF
jgi:hypothetical protein